jgi:chemotaxis protein methyltransferase CheR
MEQEAKDITGREFVFTESDFSEIRNIILEKVGISISDHKKNMIYSRISRRIRKLGFVSFKEYIAYLKSEKGSEEVVDFINAITTNLTKFFREEHHFEHMYDESLPYCFSKNASSKRLRIWSAGCSSGMEPYTIAMVLDRFMNQNKIFGWDIKILATDIDTNMLDKGKSGIYKLGDKESIPPKYSSYYRSDEKNDEIHMSEKLKNLIFFKQLNLIEEWPMKGPFDIIFCRNVVIYFNKDTRNRIFNKYADLLPESNFLYIGHSENLYEVSHRFKLEGRTTYRKIK